MLVGERFSTSTPPVRGLLTGVNFTASIGIQAVRGLRERNSGARVWAKGEDFLKAESSFTEKLQA
jgi:hypothetical protein